VRQYGFLLNYPNTVIIVKSVLFYCSQYTVSAWYPLSHTRDKKVYWVIFDASKIDIATRVLKLILIAAHQILFYYSTVEDRRPLTPASGLVDLASLKSVTSSPVTYTKHGHVMHKSSHR
jgi:hypothetical protein